MLPALFLELLWLFKVFCGSMWILGVFVLFLLKNKKKDILILIGIDWSYRWLSVIVVQLLTNVLFFATPWTAACQPPLSSIIFCSLLKFTSIEPVMLTNHLILCCPLLLLTSIFLSIRVFFSEWALHIKRPKYWSFSNSPSNEYSGLIFFRFGWFDLLAVQGILKSLLQHHNSKASFFGAQPSLWSNSHIHTWLPEKTHSFDHTNLCGR